jgi:hypothetical protein
MAGGRAEFVTVEMCAATSSQFLESQEKMYGKLDSIEKRLFRDNGAVSIQTRLDRHEQILKVLLWVVGVIGGGFLAACGSGVVMVMRWLIARGAV